MNRYGVDKRLLKSIMVANGDTANELAEYLKISSNSMSGRMNGKIPFKPNEIAAIIVRYGLSSDVMERIFFDQLLTKVDSFGYEKE